MYECRIAYPAPACDSRPHYTVPSFSTDYCAQPLAPPAPPAMSTYGTPLLRAINALDDPVLRELAGRVAVGKLLTENPSHAALRDRLDKPPLHTRHGAHQHAGPAAIAAAHL